MNPEIKMNTPEARRMAEFFDVPEDQLQHAVNRRAVRQNRIDQLAREKMYLINYSLGIDEDETKRMDHNIRYGKPHFTIDLDDQEAIYEEIQILEALIKSLENQ